MALLMKRRAAALLLLAVAGLFLVGVGLSVRLLRAGLHAVSVTTEQRLRAIGLTAARALSAGATADVLPQVARDNDLEAAYLLDEQLRPAGTSRASDFLISLLRIDPDRAMAALRGSPSVGPAYRLESAGGDEESDSVLAGYFAVPGPPHRVLVLEAGAAFVAVPTRLRATALASVVAALALAVLCALLVVAGLQAAAREQTLRAEAERGQAVREMAAMVAHELRNPLATIRAGAEILREASTDRDLCDDILSEVARLSELTSQFLQFSHDVPLQFSDVDVVGLCRDVAGRLQRAHPDTATLTIRVTGDDTAVVRADPARLIQVLINLTQNAVQAVHARGTIALAVRKIGTDGSEGAEIRVCDSGPGISAEMQRVLFTPFRTTKPTGTGLGLVVSRRIIEQHGGTLTIAAGPSVAGTTAPNISSEDQPTGACFVIRLPRKPAADREGDADGARAGAMDATDSAV